MKLIIFLSLIISSSAVLLHHGNKMPYDGKIEETISEEAAYKLCQAINDHNDNVDGFDENFYEVPLPQTDGDEIIWFTRGSRKTALATMEYRSGCYKWTMRPCYGYYPPSFTHPCTFWMPMQYPDGKCIYDYEEGDRGMFAQAAVTLDGKTAGQLCSIVNEAIGKRVFSVMTMPLKLNLRSTVRCDTWKYTPKGNDEVGEWAVEVMPDAQCNEKYPDFDVDDVEDPNMAGVECLQSLSGEIECFFNDDNMPIAKQILIQNKT